jgi:hypothetical protein
VGRADHTEVPKVRGRDLDRGVALRSRNDTGVHGSERQVAVLPDEFGDADPVRRRDGLDEVGAGCEISKQPDLSRRVKPRRRRAGYVGRRFPRLPGIT